jgi:hypothetical protein
MDNNHRVSFTSPLAHANLSIPRASNSPGVFTSIFSGLGGWHILFALFLALIVYDQGEGTPVYLFHHNYRADS